MTPTQRKILWHMHKEGEEFAACTGYRARLDGFGVAAALHGGLVFRAYSDPLYHMARGTLRFFEAVERNVPGRWYRLNEAGKAAAAKVQDPYRRH